MKRWLGRIAIAVAAVPALAGLLLFDFVRSFERSVPAYDGTVRVAGLMAPVEILRDRYAIPHVMAQSFREAAYGLGYAHAQDRLWQMEMARRFVQGRLAELFGSSALPADMLMRSMGLYEAAEEALAYLSPQSQQVLIAYTDGVNAYLAAHKGRWPIEFVLAGDTPPEPWQPADSIAVLKGMAFQLSNNAFSEAARARLVTVLGRNSVEDFFPPFSEAPLPGYLDSIYGATRTGLAEGIPDTTASDNWVVDGSHSATGKPLLANDPHLEFSIPSVWYLAHLSFPEEDMVGGTLPGVPTVISGRNRHFAVGMTNTGPDTEDLYLERINADNPRQYQVPGGGWAEFETRVETIKVRFAGEHRMLVRRTRHGPVLSDVEGSPFARAAPPGYALSLAWTALEPNDTTFDAALTIGRATTVADAKQAVHTYVTPIQNIVFADDSDGSGHIGLMLPGRVPLRSSFNDSLGLVPALGWDGRYDWQGFIPSDQTVFVEDPPSGRIATANNKTTPADYPYTLSREWEPPYRYNRIMALLAKTPRATTASFKSIQLDTVDTYALALTRRLIKAGPFQGAAAEAAQRLANWDGAMLRDRPEPLIWAAWTRALARRIYADELGANFAAFWGYRPEFTLRVLDDVDGESRWCDDRATPQVEDCGSRVRLALDDALTELSEAYGADQQRWRWGDAHKAVHAAQPFGQFPVIGAFFNREIEMDGGPYTLLRADNSMRSPTPYAAIHGAGYRGIYDLANPDQSLYIISTGQSGNVFSPHYDDLMQLWAAGGYVTIPTNREAIDRSAVHRLDLQPETVP